MHFRMEHSIESDFKLSAGICKDMNFAAISSAVPRASCCITGIGICRTAVLRPGTKESCGDTSTPLPPASSHHTAARRNQMEAACMHCIGTAVGGMTNDKARNNANELESIDSLQTAFEMAELTWNRMQPDEWTK